jgi:hypothetical protein
MGRRQRNPSRCTLGGLVLVAALPIGAAAQTPPKAPALPRFDIAGSVVWLGADADDLPGEVYRTWDATGGGVFTAGLYGTEHVKVELDVGTANEREVFGSATLESGRNSSRYIYQSHYVASRWLGLTASYQFLHNTWVHPFVGGGIDVDRERRRTETEIRTFVSSPTGSSSTIEHQDDEVVRRARVRAAFVTGAKFYVSPRLFARTDIRVSFSDHLAAVRWGAGAGVDF